MNNKIEVKQLQLKDLVSLFLSKLYIIIAFALIGAVLMFVRTKYFTPDYYASEGALVVSNITEEVLDSKNYLTSSDMDSSRSLSASCNELLLRRGFFEMVSADLQGKYSASQLRSMVAIGAVNDTEVLSVVVRARSGEDAYKVCDSVIRNAPVWIESIYDLGVVKPADNAYIPSGPVSKNTLSKTIVGFFAGTLLGMLLLLLINYFDDRIKRGSDITSRYGIPLLGEFSE